MTERLNYIYKEGQLTVSIGYESMDTVILQRLVDKMEYRVLTIPREGLSLKKKFYFQDNRRFPTNNEAVFKLNGAGQILSIAIDGLGEFIFWGIESRELHFEKSHRYMKLELRDDMRASIIGDDKNLYNIFIC